MKPRGIITLIISLGLLTLAMSATTPAYAQQRNKRKRSAQARRQTPPPQPTPPQKTQDELLLEQELAKLSGLTPENKTIVRETLESIDRVLRIYDLRGYDQYFLEIKEVKKAQALINKANEILPETSFKNLMNFTWVAFLDTWTAESNRRTGYDNDELLKLVDRYKLQGVAGVFIADKIFEQANTAFAYAIILAQRAEILSIEP